MRSAHRLIRPTPKRLPSILGRITGRGRSLTDLALAMATRRAEDMKQEACGAAARAFCTPRHVGDQLAARSTDFSRCSSNPGPASPPSGGQKRWQVRLRPGERASPAGGKSGGDEVPALLQSRKDSTLLLV